jgi:hypothetical protein
MALTLSLSYSSETPDGDGNYISVLTDTTTYATGGNPARADGALYLTLEKINYDSSVDYEIDITSYTPASVTDFTFTTTKDGWIQGKYCFIPDFNIATAYVQYDAVYEGGVVYRATQSSTGQTPPNSSYWEIISSPTSLVDNDGSATESGNIAVLVYNLIVYPFAKKLYGDLAEDYAIKCCGSWKDVEEFNAFKQMGGITTALQGCNTRSRWASGEKIARYSAQLA